MPFGSLDLLILSSSSTLFEPEALTNGQVSSHQADTSFEEPLPKYKPLHLKGIALMSQIGALNSANAVAQLSLPLIDSATLSTRNQTPAPSIDAVQNLKDTVSISLDARVAASKQKAPLA